MTIPQYTHERWLYKVTIDTSNQSIVISEDGGGAVVVNITAGDYYVHTGSSGLLGVIASALNASGSLSGTYSFEPTTPTLTNALGRCGIRMRVSGLSTSLSVTLAGGGSVTQPNMAQILGLGTDKAGGVFAGVADGADFILDSRYTYAGSWVPYERRTQYTPHPSGIAFASSEYAERLDFYVMDYGERRHRTFEYEYLPSTRVYYGRANLFAYAAEAEEALCDTMNAFELLWRRLRRGERVYVTEYDAGVGLDLAEPDTSSSSSSSDLLAFDTVESAQAMASYVQEMRRAGEFYRVSGRLVVVEDGIEY